MIAGWMKFILRRPIDSERCELSGILDRAQSLSSISHRQIQKSRLLVHLTFICGQGSLDGLRPPVGVTAKCSPLFLPKQLSTASRRDGPQRSWWHGAPLLRLAGSCRRCNLPSPAMPIQPKSVLNKLASKTQPVKISDNFYRQYSNHLGSASYRLMRILHLACKHLHSDRPKP